jgi:hypothetical protein
LPTQIAGLSDDLNAYLLQNFQREHYSDHDLALILQQQQQQQQLQQQQQQNQTKKSVSFSENIAKHLISPCNPAIKFDSPPETIDDGRPIIISSDERTHMLALHGNKQEQIPTKTSRYGEMRRCQSESIDRHHEQSLMNVYYSRFLSQCS